LKIAPPMRQVLQNLRTGETELAEIPAPAVRPGMLLIASQASLISIGTERMLVDFGRAGYLQKARQQPEKVRQVINKIKTDGLFATLDSVQARLDTPLELGYCNAGVVVDIGRDVTGYAIGDRVASNGSHAEVVCVPAHLCARMPDELAFHRGCYTVAGAIGLQGVRLAEPTLGERFVVIGLGLIGQLVIQILEAAGAKVLAVDLDAEKCRLAKPYCTRVLCGGDDLGLLEAAVNEWTDGVGVDGVILAASSRSSAPTNHAAVVTRKRGRIVQVGATGLELDRTPFFKKELRFQVSCSYGPGRYDPAYEQGNVEFPLPYVRWTEQRNLATVVDLLASGKLSVDHLTTHRFAMADVTDAYELVVKDRTALGIIIDYPPVTSAAGAQLSKTFERTSTQDHVSLPRGDHAAPVIGMLGAGGFAARFLIPNLKAAGANLWRIASSGGVNAAHCARKFGFRHATTDAASIFEDPLIDAVVIATRHDSHARYVIQALRHGKAVFVEKPLCLTPGELQDIEAAYQSATSPFVMVGYNRRFAPLVTEAKRHLDRVSVPKAIILTINAGLLPADHWHHDPKQGGGRLLAEGCHFIDLLMFLADSTVERVEAIQTAPAECGGERPDAMTVTLRFFSGTVGTMHYLANGPASFPKERIEVFAGGRALQIDNFRRLRGYQWPGMHGGRRWKQDKGHAAELQAFVTALAEGRPAPIAFDDIVSGMRICFEAGKRAR